MSKVIIEFDTHNYEEIEHIYEMILPLMLKHFPNRKIKFLAPEEKPLKEDLLKP